MSVLAIPTWNRRLEHFQQRAWLLLPFFVLTVLIVLKHMDFLLMNVNIVYYIVYNEAPYVSRLVHCGESDLV